ncbi:MAG: PaaI family thioesterase [Devosia sp.]
MKQIRTHQDIDESLSGRVKELADGRCSVEFEASPSMRADATGLVHGGFLFGAADYAAMLAVNEPTVVLTSATVQFMKPCCVGQRVEVHAKVIGEHPRKPVVQAVALDSSGAEIFRGTFNCAVLSRHVLAPETAGEE